MIKYYIHVPGWVHAMTEYGMNKRAALSRFKKRQCLSRMPRGYGIWEAEQ